MGVQLLLVTYFNYDEISLSPIVEDLQRTDLTGYLKLTLEHGNNNEMHSAGWKILNRPKEMDAVSTKVLLLHQQYF